LRAVSMAVPKTAPTVCPALAMACTSFTVTS
jgi:hypothetical protein